MRRLGHTNLLGAKRIRPEILFKELQVLRNLREKLLPLLVIFGQHPEGDGHALARHALELAFDGAVRRDVKGDAVVIERDVDEPVEGLRAVSVFLDALQPPVRRADERLRYGDVQRHRIRLVRRMVLAGPPQIYAVHLAGGRYPGLPRRRLRPDESADPGRTRRDSRLAAVLDADLHHLPRLLGHRKLNPDFSAAPLKR